MTTTTTTEKAVLFSRRSRVTHCTGFSLFNDGGAGWGGGNKGSWQKASVNSSYRRGCCGGVGWHHCVVLDRKEEALNSLSFLLRCVYPPTLWHWKKAERALALPVNEALTSLAHTHTNRTVTNSVLTAFLCWLTSTWFTSDSQGRGPPYVITYMQRHQTTVQVNPEVSGQASPPRDTTVISYWFRSLCYYRFMFKHI